MSCLPSECSISYEEYLLEVEKGGFLCTKVAPWDGHLFGVLSK